MAEHLDEQTERENVLRKTIDSPLPLAEDVKTIPGPLYSLLRRMKE